MAKAPHIPAEAKLIITEEALRQPYPPRRKVVEAIQKRLQQKGYRVPEEETLLKMVSEARNKQPSGLDKAWSLGSLATHNIPSEAIAEVVQVWKRCLAAGRTLTIREALWTARLRTTLPAGDDLVLFPESKLGALYGAANTYALRECASEVLRLNNNTADLDAWLVSMPAWEWQTAYAVGAINPHADALDERVREKERSLLKTLALVEEPLIGAWPCDTAEEELQIWPADTSRDQNLSSEAKRVYAYWLRYLSEGPKWSTLASKQHKDIALRLREEVRAVDGATRQYMSRCSERQRLTGSTKGWARMPEVPVPSWSIGPEPGPVPEPDPTAGIMLPTEGGRFPIPPFFAWKPKDLLKEVGYDINDKD